MHPFFLCIFHEKRAEKTAKRRIEIRPDSIDNLPPFRYHIYIKEKDGENFMKRRILSLVLAVVLALCLLPATAYAATTASGACGKNLTWSLSSTGTLTISGKGAMAAYDSGKMPWIAYKNQIKSVVLAKGITTIPGYAFNEYKKLTSVQIPDSVTDIGASAFDNCTALSDMTLPKNLKTLGWAAFMGCSSLKTLTIPASLTDIGLSVFSKCTGLKEVYFEKGTKSVGHNQFTGCTGLEKVVLPDGLESIGVDAFTGCTSLKSLHIPASVTEIAMGMYFARACTSLQEITVASGNRNFVSRDGALYTKDMKRLIQYPSGRAGGIVIPKGVEKLGMGSIGCPAMTSILLPSSLKLVGSGAFTGCDALTDVYFAGTEKQWILVDKGSMNDALFQAKMHYNYKGTLLPAAAKAEYIASTGKPYLKWTPVEGAAKYEVYRSGTKNGTYKRLGTTEKLNYTDKTASAGYTYFYKVKAVNAAGSKSDYSAVVAGVCRCPKPVAVPDYLSSTGKPYIKWKAVTGAAKYEVYRAASKDGKYTKVAVTTKLNYTDKDAAVGQSYYYKIKAVSKVRTAANSVFSAAVKATCHCAKPAVKITTSSSGAPKLTWNAVDGAAKYEVYRATSKAGKYTRYDTTTKTSYTNTSAKAGTTYYYKIKAVSKKTTSANSSYSAVVSVRAK